MLEFLHGTSDIRAYLHHQENSVQHDENHDEVFKRGRHNHPPDFVLETIPLFGHVSLQRFGLNREIDTSFLWNQTQ